MVNKPNATKLFPIYSDEPHTEGINIKLSERRAPEQTSGQHISRQRAEMWRAVAPIARNKFPDLWAGLHLSQ